MTELWRNNKIPNGFSEFGELFRALGNDGMRNGLFGGFAISPEFPVFWPQIYNFPLDPMDVIISSFPKSGTTWTQQIVWLIVTEDFEAAATVAIDKRIPYLEWPNPPTQGALDELAARSAPRIMKTHLPSKYLPKDMQKAKLIYVYRNAKDAVVSFYYHHLNFQMGPENLTFEQFIRKFMEGEVQYCPYGAHMTGYYEMQQQGKPILLLSYEEMKRDRRQAIVKIANFLGKTLSENLIDKIYEATSFEAMKANDAANYSWLDGYTVNVTPFMRKGATGDWRNHFTDAKLLAEFDEHIAKTVPPNMCHEQ